MKKLKYWKVINTYSKSIQNFLLLVASVVTIIGFPLLISSLKISNEQLKQSNRLASEGYTLTLNTDFLNSSNVGIIHAMNHSEPILKEHGGLFSDTELDNFIGEYDVMAHAFKSYLLLPEDLCTYGSYITTSYEYPEINKYLHDNPSAFGGLQLLYNVVSSSSDPECR